MVVKKKTSEKTLSSYKKKKTSKKTTKKRKTVKEKKISIRDSSEWKYLFDSLKDTKRNFSSIEAYRKHIDSLVKMGGINQKDILGTFNKIYSGGNNK